jgi:hypothetical protein
MLTEDYIMRMISRALAALMTALGLKKAGQLSQARQALDQALENLLGLNPNLANQLDDRALLDMLTFMGKLDPDRAQVLADIYREQAEVYTLLDQPDNSQFASQRSLRLYLEATLSSESAPSIELIQKIEPLRLQFSAPSLPLETRLALLDYLDRLLASTDEFLASAGLSHATLLAAYSSLDSADFQ